MHFLYKYLLFLSSQEVFKGDNPKFALFSDDLADPSSSINRSNNDMQSLFWV